MEKAALLLGTTFLSVKEIADKAGLGDTSHFVRDFKKMFGATPTAYRRVFGRDEKSGQRLSAANSANT